MNQEIEVYNNQQTENDRELCDFLAETIDMELIDTESKIWHGHPVWFLEGNPIVGYSKQKAGWRLMFWSGADFDEANLTIRGAKFKDASIFYTSKNDIDLHELKQWLQKSKDIQWDYKNIVKRKGELLRLK